MLRKNFAAAVIGSALFLVQSAQAEPLKATRYGDFDRYVLALSWQTGFCQSQYDRNNKPPVECRLDKEPKDKASYLTVHGLWPGLPKSIAARGVDERRWMRFGCATRPVPDMPEVRASRKCDAAETGLSLEMANRLNNVMPGSGGKSCLERYEYAKHGVCFGFDPEAYFGTMVRFNGEVKQSAIGQFLANNYGKTVSRDDFDAAIASAFGKGSVKAFKLSCSGNPAYLTEMQIAIKAAAINTPLSAASLLPQPHPGNCGNAFIVDKAGY